MALQILPRFNETDSLGNTTLKWLNVFVKNVVCDSLIVSTTKTPSTSGATGTIGEICWDSNYLYICINTNTWVRKALNTW